MLRAFEILDDRMKLSLLSLLLGVGLAAPMAYGLVRPALFAAAARKLPRSLPWGYALVTLATIWFLWNLGQESIADFAAFKPHLMFGFAAIGVGTCVFVKDFLGARGVGVTLLLVAKLMLDTGRPHLETTPWVWVIQLWAYAMIIAGMWITISPYRLRDLLDWGTATTSRTQRHCGLGLVFGLFVAGLGLTAFRGL